MSVLIILAVFWFAIQLVSALGLDDPLKRILVQVLAVCGLLFAVLACFGVMPLRCLAGGVM
jgi:hypothetical protein